MSRIIRLTESDLSRIVKNVIKQSNKEKSILKEDCVQSMGQINPKTGKTAYIDSKTGKYCDPNQNRLNGPKGLELEYNPLTKTGTMSSWFNSYPCIPNDKRFKRVQVTPTNSYGQFAFDFDNKGVGYRYFDNGFKQYIGGGGPLRDIKSKDYDEDYKPIKFSCNDEEFKLVDQACKTKAKTDLSKAVSFWKDWLNNPITRKKVEKNWDERSNFLPMYNSTFSVTSYFAWFQYFRILNNLNLVFYDQTTPKMSIASVNFFAYVTPKVSLYDIHVNCSLDNPDSLGTMIHEIQHLLYYIKPLNPAKKISNVFVDKNKKIETIHSIFDINNLIVSNKTNTLDVSKKLESSSKKIKDVSKKLNIPYEDLEWWKTNSDKEEKEDPGYVCRETEKMSNIMSVRRHLGIQPGGRITLNMITPYILGEKHNSNLLWILLCWAQRDFPDINVMLDEINALAFKQGNEKPKIGDLPKPNFS